MADLHEPVIGAVARRRIIAALAHDDAPHQVLGHIVLGRVMGDQPIKRSALASGIAKQQRTGRGRHGGGLGHMPGLGRGHGGEAGNGSAG